MAVQPINTLQNQDNYNVIAKEYVLESLANLGQRYNVKGDSISIAELSLGDLFDFTTTDGCEDMLAVVEKISGEYSISLRKKDDLTTVVYPEKTLSPSNNSLTLDSFQSQVNPTTLYTNFTFSVDDLYYTFVGRQESTTSRSNYSIIKERYSRNGDYLETGIRVYRTHFTSLINNYLLVYVKQTSVDNEYNVKLYVSTSPADSINEEDMFNVILNGDLYDTSWIESMFTLLLGDICTMTNNVINPTETMLAWDGFTSVDQDILTNQILYSFKDDYLNLYPYLKERYSSSVYGNLNSIAVELLQKLYDKIKAEEDITNSKYDSRIYIPLIYRESESNQLKFYSISYIYNTNVPEEIYFAGREIDVRFVSSTIDDNWMTLNFEDYRGSIISQTGIAERVSFYHFESVLDNSHIMNIVVKKISTLPYIDDNGYWVINDISTGIYARGRHAGNPNFILVETTDINGGFNILSGAKKEELLKDLAWIPKIAKIEPLEKINLENLSFVGEYDYFQVKCSIPDLTQLNEVKKNELMPQLENALIVCISPISCIIYNSNNETDNINYTRKDVEEIYGEYGVITTIWAIDDNGEFDYIRKRNNQIAAADFNYLSNINNLINYAVQNVEPVHPDRYTFTHVVFDPTTTTLKNNTTETRTYIYPNIVNKTSSEYNSSNYNNDLNITPKFNDTMLTTMDGKNIAGLAQSELRYLNTENDATGITTNIVTNSLYSYYTSGINGRYNEYIPNYNVPTFDLSEVLTRNETLLNRLNILSFNSSGVSYLSYIGTSVDKEKTILTIGTTDTNINIGTSTLAKTQNNFTPQTKLEIDFDDVKISGETNITGNLTVDKDIMMTGTTWAKDYINVASEAQIINTTYYTTIYTAASRYIYELNDKQPGNKNAGIIQLLTADALDNLTSTEAAEMINNTSLSSMMSYALFNYAYSRNKLYTISSIVEYYTTTHVEGEELIHDGTNQHYIYFSDGIYVPVLMKQLGLDRYINKNKNYIDISNVKLTSNMEIVTVNESPIILLSSSTNLYPDKYLYTSGTDRVTNFTYTMFTSNPMKITYYAVGRQLYLHVEELYGNSKYVTSKKLKYKYTTVL